MDASSAGERALAPTADDAHPGLATPESSRGVALLIAAAAVAIAVAGGRAVLLRGEASVAQQKALDSELGRGAATFGATLPVYALAGPLAEDLLRASTRAEAYDREFRRAAGPVRAPLAVEREAQKHLALTLALALADPSSKLHGDSVPATLARLRAQALANHADPDERERHGDALSTKAAWVLAAAVPAAAALLLGGLADAGLQRRRLAAAGWILIGASVAMGTFAEVVL